jgi:SNF2 family DNA or RNA helicase
MGDQQGEAAGAASTVVPNDNSWKKLQSLCAQLRKACNHPFLFPAAEAAIRPAMSEDADESIITASGKMVMLDRLLKRLKAGGHRAVIFSQFTRMLDIVDDYMRLRGHPFVRLDGGTSRVQRTIDIQEFNKPDSRYFAFLMSTRAGGLGINAQTADTVIPP